MSEDSDSPASDSDSDPPQRDEITGIHDVPKPMRTWAASQSRKVRKMEKHFEKGGMVFDLHADWTAVTKSFGFWIKVAPILGALAVAGIGALMWIIHASVAAQAAPPPNAQDIAREVVKAQQK